MFGLGWIYTAIWWGLLDMKLSRKSRCCFCVSGQITRDIPPRGGQGEGPCAAALLTFRVYTSDWLATDGQSHNGQSYKDDPLRLSCFLFAALISEYVDTAWLGHMYPS